MSTAKLVRSGIPFHHDDHLHLSPHPDPEDPEPSNGLPSWAIALLVVLVMLSIIAIGAVLYVQRSRQQRQMDDSENRMDSYESGSVDTSGAPPPSKRAPAALLRPRHLPAALPPA